MPKFEDFEVFVAKKCACPKCGKKGMKCYPPSFPAFDVYCPKCNAQVQVKRNQKNTYTTHRSSYASWRKAVRKHGAKNIWFVIGTMKSFRVHWYPERIASDRKVREYRPSSKDIARRAGIRVSSKGKPYGYDNWAEAARDHGLMIQQDSIKFKFAA